MKLTPLFAAAAWLAKRDLATITSDLSAIQNATLTLNTAVLNFSSVADVTGLLAATADVNTAIQKGTADATATGNLTAGEAASLILPIDALIKDVQLSVQNTINKQCTFAGLGLTSSVEVQLQGLRNNSQVFSDTLIANIPAFFQPTAEEFATPIITALQEGVDAFAPNATSTSGASPSISCLANGTTVHLSSAGAPNRISFGLGSIAAVALIAVAL